MRLQTGAAILLLTVSSTVIAQNVSNSPTGLEILQAVSRRYSEAKSYHIELVEERTTTNDYERNWQKKILIAEEAPNNRYRFEGRSATGNAMRISDGTNIWVYHVEGNLYTKKTVGTDSLQVGGPIPISEMALEAAADLREQMENILIRRNKSIERLPDATITIQGREVPCYVVLIKSDDGRKPPSGAFETTYWIEKASNIVRQSATHDNSYMIAGIDRIPIEIEAKTTYTVTELNSVPPSEHFTFTPPSGAAHVEDFPFFVTPVDTTLAGKQLPALTVKSADGSKISLDSFRGKPMLIDIWSTWCAPCIKDMPQMAKLYQETKSKGIVSITIDRDDEARTASDFLKQKGYEWPNFHDDGGEKNALGMSGVPRTLIVDKQGKIVYDKVGANDEQLRRELSKLDPEYASLAPQQNVTCEAAK